MKAFQTVLAALAAVGAVNGQFYRYGSSALGGLYSGGLSSYGSGLSLGSGLYGASYAPAVSYGARYSTVSAAPAVSYRTGYSTIGAVPTAVSYGSRYAVAAAPAVSYATRVHAAPAVSYATRVHAAPAVSYATQLHAAPAVSYVAAAPALSTRTVQVSSAPQVAVATRAVAAPVQPVQVGVVATAGTPTVRSHEVHTGSGRQTIRIEDFQAGDQVVRVHEGPQAAPEIAQIQVPGEQHHVRVVEHQSGPAHVERVVSRAETQFVEVQKPGRPGVRVVQVVKGQSPAPSVEFVSDGGSSHHVYYADDLEAGTLGGAASLGATTFHTTYAGGFNGGLVASSPVVSTVSAVPASAIATRTVRVSAAPTVTAVHAAPAVHAVHATPIVATYGTQVHSTPIVSTYGTRVHAAPAVSYSSYAPTYGLGGFNYGGLGYSTGYTSYGSGGNVYLDAQKKASAAKKSA